MGCLLLYFSKFVSLAEKKREKTAGFLLELTLSKNRFVANKTAMLFSASSIRTKLYQQIFNPSFKKPIH
ncbi:hypothetical protein ACTXT7_014476 [Hymenolepis weldensis]